MSPLVAFDEITEGGRSTGDDEGAASAACPSFGQPTFTRCDKAEAGPCVDFQDAA